MVSQQNTLHSKMIKDNIKEIKSALEASGNAALVARQFGLTLKQIYYFCKTRNIKLHSGRPKKYNYNKTYLLRAIKRAIKKNNGLSQLAERWDIPYHVITNLSKKIK